MSERNDGGPAFPTTLPEVVTEFDCTLGDVDRDVQVPYPGISIRDYFAAKAMHAYETAFCHPDNEGASNKKIAQMAYELADAMLAERGK